MPVIYQIDPKTAVIRTRCVGHVTLEEVLDHFRTLESDADCPEILDVLLDFREILTLPSDAELRAVSEEIARVRPRVRFGACAIVASSDAQFGTAKVFEVFAARSFRTTTVVRGPGEGEGWLAVQRAKPG
jgi:hypothetical protein